MRIGLARRERFPAWMKWAGPVFALWLGLNALAAYYCTFSHRPWPGCIFKRITGLPCPSCGLGRAGMSVLSGNLLQGFLYNPLFCTLLALLAFIILLRLSLGLSPKLTLSRWETGFVWLAACSIVALNWLYVIFFVG